MIFLNVNRVFQFCLFCTSEAFFRSYWFFFHLWNFFWSMSYFSVFNDLSNILTIFFQLFLFFKFQAHFSTLWICLAFRIIFSKIWWHLLFVWLFIQNCNLQYLPFFSAMHIKPRFRIEFNFFDDFFQHQNLLSELDFFSVFNDCFKFFTIPFPFFNDFCQLFCISQILSLFELMNFSTLKTFL